jgi:hypothetical protein
MLNYQVDPMKLHKHIVLFALCSAVFQSTALGTSATLKSKPQMQNMIAIQIIAEPLQFSMDERANFKIGMEARNVGDEAINPKLYESELLVEGERSLAWNLAVSNGLREEAWWNLEPGKTVTASWSLGEAMFPQPGKYEVVLRLGTQESSVRVWVTP